MSSLFKWYNMHKRKKIEWLWDFWCVCSLIGIWPRFIEPNLIQVKRVRIPIQSLPKELEGITCLQISDLHWSQKISPSFFRRLSSRINLLNPDLICLTGDFLCFAKLDDSVGLKKFLNSLKAKLGCFAVYGNHDYADYVTIDQQGNYIADQRKEKTTIKKGFERLFSTIVVKGAWDPSVRTIGRHEELDALLKTTPFRLLHNETIQIRHNEKTLNITGLGEHMLAQSKPEEAFSSFEPSSPGIILTHNPDAIPYLKGYPGDLVLAGHTHGGQVNLPFMWKKFTHMEQLCYKRGLGKAIDKWVYVNRGVGSVIPFRWFSVPEITLFTFFRSP